MGNASTPTLLSLDRYSQIMGLDPLAFNQGSSAIVFPSSTGQCHDTWYQNSWQFSDQVSRNDLARSISSAERDLAEVLGYWPAPTWIETEPIRYPQHYRPDVYGVGMWNIRGQKKAVKLRWGKFIQGGQRVSTLQDTVAPVYSDADGDGFDETVTITLAGIDSDALACEIKVYYPGFSGNSEYEIRPARTSSLSLGTYSATFWSWQFFDLDLINQLPISGFTAIPADDAASYITTVEVRWTYNSYVQAHGTIYWENDPTEVIQCAVCAGVGCEACSFITQDVCIHVRDTLQGFAAVTPAAYDTDSESWGSTSPAVGRDPDQVTVNYYSGEQSDKYLAEYKCDPMPLYLAEAIAWMATARLERPYCSCGVMTAHSLDLRRDLSITSTKEIGYFTGDEIHTNPFGTRLGEVRAWRRIRHLADSVNVGVAVG